MGRAYGRMGLGASGARFAHESGDDRLLRPRHESVLTLRRARCVSTGCNRPGRSLGTAGQPARRGTRPTRLGVYCVRLDRSRRAPRDAYPGATVYVSMTSLERIMILYLKRMRLGLEVAGPKAQTA